MPALIESAIAHLLQPYLSGSGAYPDTDLDPSLLSQFSTYLDLLLKWNARTNLTAIRDPEEIVRRHFGESLFAARHIPAEAKTLLDFGSGAGFPGLPITRTPIRAPEEILRRHSGKSLFAARHIPAEAKTLLDFGSGAGFPGLPI